MYFIPRENVVDEVLIPALKSARSVDCMAGFFSSHSFAEIAPGLATFLARSAEPLRLIISPYLSPDDQEAMRLGVSNPETVASAAILDAIPSAGDLANHTLRCLAWLIRANRLEIRIALIRGALFHPKVWIFKCDSDRAALHGSSNMTRDGLTRNREQVTLSRSWCGAESVFHIDRLQKEFEEIWSGDDADCVIVDLPRAIREKLLREFSGGQAPTEADCRKLWRKAHGLPEMEPGEATDFIQSLAIPDSIEYRSGPYGHQGRAVDAWKQSGWRGILEMATGSGKTISAMIGASLLQQEVDSLFIVIAAPYRPLIEQWCGEVEPFGVRPANLTLLSGSAARDGKVRELGRKLRMGLSKTEVVLVSTDTLCTADFIGSVMAVRAKKLLIADECHNLGAAGFVSNPPECFDFRLGLSATPIRQYDEEGTEALFEYFGPVCFQFTLEDAIGVCLTPYDYHIHFVELSRSEMDEWVRLSDEISKLAWKLETKAKDSHLDNLLRQRRLVLETAAAKLATLKLLLSSECDDTLGFTLIYATDKDPAQLERVNAILQEKGILFRQLTYEETVDRKKTAEILSAFQAGEIKVLTAKRVLDEGVNIPQIKRAYILASTTVRRQWIQRRGRLLRTCRQIGKTHAEIHDFVALPPGGTGSLDSDARRIVKSELDRVWEFTRLCRNGADDQGPYQAVRRLQEMLGAEGG
jgi:superfamily II DNA or RNA helicase